MSDYTPGSIEVSDRYAASAPGGFARRVQAREEFARWLAAHDAEVAAHALEAAASAAVTDDDGIPWDDDYDRATVSAWLAERADDLREGADQ